LGTHSNPSKQLKVKNPHPTATTGQQGLPWQHTSTPPCKITAASGTLRQLLCPLRYVLQIYPAESTKDLQETNRQMKTWKWLPVMTDRLHTGTYMVEAHVKNN